MVWVNGFKGIWVIGFRFGSWAKRFGYGFRFRE